MAGVVSTYPRVVGDGAMLPTLGGCGTLMGFEFVILLCHTFRGLTLESKASYWVGPR